MKKLSLTFIFTAVLIIGLTIWLKPFGIFSEASKQQIKVVHDRPKKSGSVVNRIAGFPVLKSKQAEIETIQNRQRNNQQGIEPKRIEIPAIQAKAAVKTVGEAKNGEMEVPANTVETGWYSPATHPGSNGNAVIAGHVDSKKGPAVFFYLKELQPGDNIYLYDKNKRKLTFTVRTKKSYLAEKAPVSEIFGSNTKPMLNLITCTGTFDHKRRTHIDRLVVSAELTNDSGQEHLQKPVAPTHLEKSGQTLSWHSTPEAAVVGYNVYAIDTKTGTKKRIAKVASHERKSVMIKSKSHEKYGVTAVNYDLEESVLALVR